MAKKSTHNDIGSVAAVDRNALDKHLTHALGKTVERRHTVILRACKIDKRTQNKDTAQLTHLSVHIMLVVNKAYEADKSRGKAVVTGVARFYNG